jgi:hypothetical protein
MRDPRRGGRLAKPTVPVPSRARTLLWPSSLWTAESGFFAAAQVRRSLNADRPDADPGPVGLGRTAGEVTQKETPAKLRITKARV